MSRMSIIIKSSRNKDIIVNEFFIYKINHVNATTTNWRGTTDIFQATESAHWITYNTYKHFKFVLLIIML